MDKELIFKTAIRIGDYKNPKQPNPDHQYKYQWVESEISRDELCRYDKSQVGEVMNQGDVVSVIQVNLSLQKFDSNNAPIKIIHARFLCGMNVEDELLITDNHLVAAPCPPFCAGGR